MIKNILVAFCISIMLYLMNFHQTQSSAWVAPYLSAAKNFDFSSLVMHVDQSQIDYFSQLTREEQFKFNFEKSENIVQYEYLAIGFYFVAIIATKIFFFLGDLESIQLLQQLTHMGISILILNQFSININKLLFVFIYALNPIVLYFVNFPYYYFWQILPASIFIYYYLSNKKIGNIIFLVAFVMFILYLIRPTILFFSLFFFIWCAIKENWKKSIISMILFLGLINCFHPHSFGPWHTMYIGIGAYNNNFNIKLSDESGYDYFRNTKGKMMNSYLISNNELRRDYYDALKNRYLQIIQLNYLLIFKNAVLNIIGSYGFGYKPENKVLIYINILCGLVFMTMLLYSKQYILFSAIGISSISFTLYYPPIGAYMCGSYILIAIGIINIISYYYNKKEQ
ncbi:hypothetical protein [Campylobacter hyointestinalis]|uniref:hypothetical protein n=1 Tax=Campylobacter hyointestinalis TaxID=198 RepID=UPI002552F0C6|nr:hypothetical protein [Campylobacter hyointestinalis]MDL2346075.1 hypothetical protein [Campylobacter hyointestinalis]MDL2347815.1 hypothetical protein [Campylobacter hyointestinalis]MDL2349557.1 hypothetical protein [Campylobacter hyointestinalis]MDM1025768.1 hypothetical protein [Campylobacter hyointestinalis]MDM1028425.1 hypothetical protein [Campylobacter hyointestinalis]